MKRFFAMLLFLSITFLGGCTQTATKISENSDETIQPSVELSFFDDMLSHNNNASDAICYDWLEAQIHQFSIDDVKNAFFADDPIISDENSDYGSYSVYVALGLSGAYLQMEYNSTTRQTIFYKTPWYDPKVHLLVKDYPADIDSFNKNNIDKLPQGEDLAFATVQEAEDSVRKVLELLGCENVGTAEVYSLSPEILTSLDESIRRVDDDGNDMPMQTWTDEDACYYIVFREEYDGLVFSREGIQWAGTNIVAYYSARGIEYMSISTPLEVTATGQQIEVPSVEDAKAMITDKYNSIIMTAPATVEEISLEYIMTVDQGTLVPSWRIIVDESTAQIPYKCCVRFDALTGKELTW